MALRHVRPLEPAVVPRALPEMRRGYGYRDRDWEAVEERTVITYPTDRSESDE